MSILTFLFFTCFVYFVTADPIETSPSDQEPLDCFSAAVGKAFDECLEPLFEPLSEEDRDCFKIIALNGVDGHMNFALYQMRQETAPESSGQPMKDNDVVLFYDSTEAYFPSKTCKEPTTPCEAA